MHRKEIKQALHRTAGLLGEDVVWYGTEADSIVLPMDPGPAQQCSLAMESSRAPSVLCSRRRARHRQCHGHAGALAGG
jgi:hypothetical protein